MKRQKSYFPSANKNAANNSDIDYKVLVIFSTQKKLQNAPAKLFCLPMDTMWYDWWLIGVCTTSDNKILISNK